MKRRILECITAGCILISMTGCGAPNREGSDESVSSNAAMAANSGTFDESVFDRICKEVVIAGKQVDLPCSLQDLGKGFEAEYLFSDPEQCQSVYALTFNNQELGSLSYRSSRQLEGEALQNADIAMFSFTSGDDSDVSVAGLRLGDTASSIEEKLGNPTVRSEKETNSGLVTECTYLVGDAEDCPFGERKRINFVLLDGVLYTIHLGMPTEDYSSGISS